MKQGHSYCDGASLPASARIAEATHAVEKQAILPARSARNTSRVTAVRMPGAPCRETSDQVSKAAECVRRDGLGAFREPCVTANHNLSVCPKVVSKVVLSV